MPLPINLILVAFFPYRTAVITGITEQLCDPSTFWEAYEETIPERQKSNHAVYVMKDKHGKLHGFFVHDTQVRHFKDDFNIRVGHW